MLPFLRKSRIRPRYLRAPPLSRQTATLSSKSDCFSRRKLNLNRQQVLQNMARPSTMSVYREKEKQWSFYPRSVSYFSTLTGDDENDTENLKSSNSNNNNRASSLSPKEEILLSLCQDIPNAVEEIISSVEEEEELQRQRQLQEEDNDEENIHTLKSRFGRDKESLRTRFDRSWDAHRREKLISQQQSTTNSDPWVIGDEKDLDFLTMFESQGWDNLASEENVANISAGDDKEESPWEEQHDDSKQVNIGVMENASEETLSSSNTDFDVISGNKADGVDVVLVDSTHHAVDENECLSDALAATSPVITKDETDITSSNDTDGIIQEQGELDATNSSKGAHMEDILQEETDKSLLLLKNMSARDWRLFDSDGGSEEFSKDAFDFEKMNLEELNDTKGLQDRFPLDGNREHQLVVAEEEEAETPNQLELVQDLLEEARNGTIELSTKEYNLLLSRMATAIDLSVEDVMDTLLRIYHQMKKLAMPDETTYEILVFALDRRVSGGSGSSNRTIRDLLKDMVHFKVQLSSNLLLKQGIRCCDQDNDVKLAKRLIVDYALGDENRTYKVSTRVIRSLMKMFARENMQKDAINLLEKCLKVSVLDG